MLRVESILKNSIEVYWQVNCVDDAIVIGYNISFCLVYDDNLEKCRGEQMNSILIDTEFNKLTHHRIEGLKSYRNYAVSIALLSAKKHGLFEGPQVIRTLEDGNSIQFLSQSY